LPAHSKRVSAYSPTALLPVLPVSVITATPSTSIVTWLVWAEGITLFDLDLLASAIIYVDGAITGNILYGGRARESDSIPALWRAKHPSAQMPRLRYWIIFNNQFRFPPQVTQARWPDIMTRATIMAVPDDWVPPKPGTFVKEVMNDLADLGEKMGADPASWRTDPPYDRQGLAGGVV
jgi:hypothetical protein